MGEWRASWGLVGTGWDGVAGRVGPSELAGRVEPGGGWGGGQGGWASMDRLQGAFIQPERVYVTA